MATPTYPANTTVIITVPFPTENGVAIVPNSVTRVVYDEAGSEVVAGAVTIPEGATDAIDIIIPEGQNICSTSPRGLRRVVTSMGTDVGTFINTSRYVIEEADALIPLVNSFQTLDEAFLVSRELVRLDGWSAAEEADQVSAMTLAWARLCKMTYRYRGAFSQSRISFEPYSGQDYGDWTYVTRVAELTEEDWAQLPADFVRALKRAQLAEADVLLKGDPVSEKRRAGIISETIGESSMFFRQVPEVDIGISKEALGHLRGFTYRDTRIARA